MKLNKKKVVLTMLGLAAVGLCVGALGRYFGIPLVVVCLGLGVLGWCTAGVLQNWLRR